MTGWLIALVAVVALALSSVGGAPLTAAVLRLAARSGGALGPEGEDADGDGPTGLRAREALRGGTLIGVLERTAVTGILLLGYPPAVAFVVAVKGLGRYPELRGHPGTSERFVIGTLASLLWAGAVGVLGRALVAGETPGLLG